MNLLTRQRSLLLIAMITLGFPLSVDAGSVEEAWSPFYGTDNFEERMEISFERRTIQSTADSGAVSTKLSYAAATTPDVVTIASPPEAATEPPSLTAPASGSFNKNPVTVTYTLPAAASPGSVTLTFDDTIELRSLVVGTDGESSGTHTLALDLTNPLESGAFVSGPAVPDGYYDVTLSYQDESGNSASSPPSSGVTIDTVAPTVELPTNTTLHTPTSGGAALAFEIKANDLLDPAPVVVASPPSGTIYPVGLTPVTVTATDRSGNVTTTGFTVTVILVTNVPDPVNTVVAMKGFPVPATPGSGIPPGAYWTSFGRPSLHDGGAFIGFSATIRTPGGKVTGVFDGPPGASVLLFRKGDLVPSDDAAYPLTGVKIAGYKEPVFPSQGEDFASAVLANLTGIGVDQTNSSAILLGTAGGTPLRMVARQGGQAPGFPTGGSVSSVGKFRSFTSVAMPGNATVVWFTATLDHSGGVTAANDAGLWIWDAQFGARLVLRKGEAIVPFRTQKVKSFRVLELVPGSPGHGRYGMGFAGAQVSLEDGTDAVFNIQVDGGIENDLATGPPPNPTGPWPARFGIPNWRQTQDVPATLRVTLDGPGVTEANRIAIMDSAEVIARTGSSSGLADGSVFKSFQDPVTALDQDGFAIDAFPATLSGGSTTTSNNASLWWWHGGAPALGLLAREGQHAPGGGHWKSFTSLTAIEQRGPAFTATLTMDGKTITERNNKGLWAVNSRGVLQLLLRKGNIINGRRVRAFDILQAVSGSPGQRRAWSEMGDPAVIWRALLDDGSTAIIRTTVP